MSKEQESQTATESSPITAEVLLKASPRWHLALPLKVAEGFGERFQPTGFPNLGPALYKAVFDNVTADYLLVESAQSLANWMEHVCIDPSNPCEYNKDCKGIPYAVVKENEKSITSSLTEPHRLAATVVIGTRQNLTDFGKQLQSILKIDKTRPVHIPDFAKRMFYVDPACLLHGVFLDQLDNRVRFARLVTASITAKCPQSVNSGGQMRGYETLETKDGEANSIPYSRQEFTSREIILDLTFHRDSLKALGLDVEQENFMTSFALYKINKLLASFPRLRTACVFDPTLIPKIEVDLPTQIEKTFTEERRKDALGKELEKLPKPFLSNDKPRGFEPFVR